MKKILEIRKTQKEFVVLDKKEQVDNVFDLLKKEQVKIPEGHRSRYLYPFLCLKLTVRTQNLGIQLLDIVSICPSGMEGSKWLKFSIPVNRDEIIIDMQDFFEMEERNDLESLGYYSRDYSEGFYLNFHSDKPIEYDLELFLKDKLSK